MPTILTEELHAGFDAEGGAPCPYLATSPASDAWHVGRHMRQMDDARPKFAAAGRGNSVRVDKQYLFKLGYAKDGSILTIDCICT